MTEHLNHIDAHVHVWTDDFARYPLGEGYTAKHMPVPRYLPEAILGDAKRSGVGRVVLIQMNFYGFDNSYMLDTIAQHPGTFRGVAVIDHTAADPAREMRRLKPLGVRGFRIVGLGEGLDHWLDHPGYDAMFRCAAEERMAICALLVPEALAAVSKMCERFPDTPVVIDHLARIGCGVPITPNHIDMLCGMARHKNTFVKASAFYALGAGKAPYDDMIPVIRRVCDAFGPSRVMWASDCPFQTLHGRYEDSVSLVRERLDFLSADDKAWLLHRTAERVFFA